jgi:hypothetical protein
MEETIIDVSAEEIVEDNSLENIPDIKDIKAKINQKELNKVIKKYKKYRRSIFAEINRIDNAYVES